MPNTLDLHFRIITPTLAYKFWWAEREGDWLRQQQCPMKRCCPISLLPVITTTQDGSHGICVTCSTFLLLLPPFQVTGWDVQHQALWLTLQPAWDNHRKSATLIVARYDIYRKCKTSQHWRHCLLQSATCTSLHLQMCPSTGAALESSRPPWYTSCGHHQVWMGQEGRREGGRESHHACPGCQPRCSSCLVGHYQL